MLGTESTINNSISYAAKEIRQPFTKEKKNRAVKKIKHKRSPDPDELARKLIKYMPIEIHQEISNTSTMLHAKEMMR